jgi:hypothetical protein
MKHAESGRKCYERVVSLSLVFLAAVLLAATARHPRVENRPCSGQTHEYRPAGDTSTTNGVSDSDTH